MQLACGPLLAEDFSAEDLEFFEKQVRPLLVEKCLQCHDAKQQKGGLRLDSRDAALKGGETGPSLKPGDADASLLIEAINYDPDGYQMPPTGKLAPEQIAVLTEWVRRKAPWPDTRNEAAATNSAFNLAERARHWSFQPIRSVTPPDVQRTAATDNPIDRFLVARLEAEQLVPAKLAEKSVQLRRLSFELIGLPPTIAELEEFQSDANPDAYERAVDRLLASPHYGERWARHWLDLVRYAETYGHEFDFEIRYPHVYRDYVIRALNADVPYDQFVKEHIAGDLLPEPRRELSAGTLESVIGTAFWWFGQGKHSPVDIRAEECDTVDNQLDVFGKTFLGLTIACARCHDHKFDPITQKDYYALAGYLQSSRQAYAEITPPEPISNIVQKLTRQDESFDLLSESLPRWHAALGQIKERLLSNDNVTAETKAAWQQRVREEAQQSPRHPLSIWARWPNEAAQVAEFKAGLRRANASLPTTQETAIKPPVYPLSLPEGWIYEGAAFHREPFTGLHILPGDEPQYLIRGAVSQSTWIHSGTVAPQLQGTLRSPTFTIDKPYLDVLALRRGGAPNPLRGDYKSGQLHVIVDGFQIIRNPLYGHLSLHIPHSETVRWYRIDLSRFLGQRAYMEIEDADDGEIVIEQMQLHDQGVPPLPGNELLTDVLLDENVKTADDAASTSIQTISTLLDRLRQESQNGTLAFAEEQSAAAADIINWLTRETSLLDGLSEPSPQAVAFAEQRRALLADLPRREFTLAMTQGTPENEFLLIRGNAKKPGDEVPRRFLEVFAGEHDADSTRLELAQRLTDGANPLVPRVIANRLWQHLFGRGLVPTPDDFGKMGQPPSHPELLDWLARELMRSEWSLKHLQRQMVTSQAFRRSSRAADEQAEQRDPQNLLLHRANLQRLEAEAIRDALLQISGRLNDRMSGPSVPTHLTEFMEGRGRPGASGPLDGEGRRSLYLGVRRNFLSPLFLAFDFPTPFTSMGRRSTSNVPAQALTLMNNPLVAQQAELWVQQTAGASPADRIRRLYLAAFGRSASFEEIQAAEEFLAAQVAEYGSANDPRAWNDLAHVLLNVKEFVFVE